MVSAAALSGRPRRCATARSAPRRARSSPCLAPRRRAARRRPTSAPWRTRSGSCASRCRPASSTSTRVRWRRGEERAPDLRPERDQRGERQRRDRARCGDERAPAPGRDQHQRDQHAELRLVGDQAEQHAGEHRPAVEHHQRAAEQRRGEKAVVAVADVDEHGREGERQQQPEPALQRDEVQRASFRAARPAGRIAAPCRGRAQRRRLPDRERERVGHQRQQPGDEQEERRIVPAVERRLRRRRSPARGRVRRPVERRGGLAVEHKGAGGIDVGEVGAERAAGQSLRPSEVASRKTRPMDGSGKHREPPKGGRARG